jgi:uncharacterized protein
MEMTGEQHVAAPRQKVWDALNDPAVLAQCIPGCQSLEKEGDDRFLAVAEVKIGPIGGRFKGQVQLSDLDAPNGYTIAGSGSGGIAGSAKGGAKVRLSDAADGGTLVAYEVEADVGGRMAQLGGPIIDATAKNLANKFFVTFGQVVSGQQATAPAAGGTAATPALPSEASSPAPAPVARPAPVPAAYGSFWGWIVALVLAMLTGYVLGGLAFGQVALLVGVLLIVVAAVSYEAGRRGGGR